jgi:hypothetical protein
VSGPQSRNGFTENLEAVARGVRRLEEVRDPILREAVAAALRLHARELRLDPASRARMRNTVLAALEPAKPTVSDKVYGLFAVLGMPAPVLVRALAVVVLIGGLLGSATVAGADSVQDDPLYAMKLAGEQLRLAIAVGPEDRASVELSIAEHRLDEAERLATAGREDAAIVATAGYGSSLADAAADLASVEATNPRTAGLVQQLQSTLVAGQQRVAITATRLATDARTASMARVLAAVSATAAPSTGSPATKIADQAAAITAQLASFAGARANSPEAPRTPRPVPTPSATASIRSASARPSTSRPATAASPARSIGGNGPSATPSAQQSVTDDDEDGTVAQPASVAQPFDRVAARAAAERAKEAAARAWQAAEKARNAAPRTPTPSPTRR